MGKNDSTVKNVNDPWKPIQGSLKNAAKEAGNLFNSGGFGQVAGFGDASNLSQSMIMNQAGQPGLTPMASGTLSGMMDPSYQSDRLDAVKNNVLGSAIPAAVSMFSGSGMTNSSQAMDTVGRAATQAVAPYEYQAAQDSQNRAMQAAGMAPAMDQAGYMPAQMIGAVGGAQDAMSQSLMDQEKMNYQGYLNSIMGLGGMGGTGAQTSPGASTGQMVGSSLMGGLGTYGALMGNPVTAPFALMGGIGSGMMGLF